MIDWNKNEYETTVAPNCSLSCLFRVYMLWVRGNTRMLVDSLGPAAASSPLKAILYTLHVLLTVQQCQDYRAAYLIPQVIVPLPVAACNSAQHNISHAPETIHQFAVGITSASLTVKRNFSPRAETPAPHLQTFINFHAKFLVFNAKFSFLHTPSEPFLPSASGFPSGFSKSSGHQPGIHHFEYKIHDLECKNHVIL